MAQVYVKNLNQSVEIESSTTAIDLSQKLGLTEPHQAVSVVINNELKDLSSSINDSDVLEFLSFNDALGKQVYWHTSAHVLAQAVLRLYPNAKTTIGPPIENGFYYDFADLSVAEEDLSKIEKEMQKICSENFVSEKKVFCNKQEALESFKDNSYKQELIQEFDSQKPITGYRQGEFFDLCRGPHLPKLGKIKAIKILKTSGAYWRGKPENEMLTRIYGISFPDKKMLSAFLTQVEEAKKRDHKVLGPKLDLFSLKEESPGMAFIHPHGLVIWNRLIQFWQSLHQKAGYVEIKTPTLMTRQLWETSGHWKNYRENMYTLQVEERDFAIKPMNCPGCMLFYQGQIHSYRELPLKVAEIGHVFRYEPSGAISGLFRLRSFHQDDAHIFMKKSDIQSQIVQVIQLLDTIYTTLGLEYHLELSTRPEKNTIGTDEDWQIATEGLKNALEATKRPYRINEGDGAFYGPKIDIHVRDAIGRTWQCGTIQLDMALPEKFNLEYTGEDGKKHRPIMIHRALLGSIERFFGILIEHFAGKFPLWLSPRQICIICVADRHVEYAKKIGALFQENEILCDIDYTQESVSKKIRQAQLLQYNYMLTIGDKEMEDNKINVRTRSNQVVGEMDLKDFISIIEQEIKSKSLVSSFDQVSKDF